jgi:hypothetical protein
MMLSLSKRTSPLLRQLRAHVLAYYPDWVERMWIDLEGLANLRDVGGIPTVDGGKIVRSAAAVRQSSDAHSF